MANPWAWWTAEEIAAVAGCPVAAVREHWPIIADSLDRRGLYERDVARGVIGTVAIESASTFQPVIEAFWLPDSWRKANLRYYPFYGRGYLQITWEDNYRAAGEALGVDLVGHPDRALELQIAADVLAWFWATKGVRSKDGTRWYSLPDLCREGDWRWVRRVVQGGEDGLDRLLQIVNDLGGAPMAVTYNANEPAHPQDKSFDCSQESLEWALWALGRKPADGWLESTMIAEGVMSEANGLEDATGAGLAAFVGRHYGEFGFYANHEASVSFDDVANEGTGPDVNGKAYPLLIGGRAWGHWSGVRGYDAARDVLLLANPSDGWKGVGQTMSRAQFAQLGEFSMVRVLHPDLLRVFDTPTVPEPPIVLPPPFDRAAAAARVRAILAYHDESAARVHADLTALLEMLEAA